MMKQHIRLCFVAAFLLMASCAPPNSSSASPSPTPELTALSSSPTPSVGLAEAYKNYFPIGAAVSPAALSRYGDMIPAQFSSITAENVMKPQTIAIAPGQYDFSQGDLLADYAKSHGMHMRGHTLIWHQQTPDWFFTDDKGQPLGRDALLARMEEYIKAVVGHYKGKVQSWDVVNEAIDDGSNTLRASKWQSIIGDDYLDFAFKFAHEADPDAKLFLNDYNLNEPAKREAVYDLAKGMLERGVPIDGIGMQCHVNIYYPSPQDEEASIKRFAELGLKVQVTEMDLSIYNWNDSASFTTEPEDRLALQNRLFEQYFEVFRRNRDVITSVTFWGVADDYTWLDNYPVPGRKNFPFLFDVNHNPKEAYQKIIDAASHDDSPAKTAA